MRNSIRSIISALVVVGLAGCSPSGCDGGDVGGDESQSGDRAEVRSDAGTDASTPQIRTAFGIPLPPEGKLISESSSRIEWYTQMSVVELADYYQGRLTDYEVLQEGLTIRIVGLRSGMAHAYGTHEGKSFRAVSISFFAGEPPGPSRLTSKNLDGTEKEKVEPRPTPPTHFGGGKKGSPVSARLPSGELIAPGARWGEPYTPPKGSFYDKPKFKPNWGRPFGDWRAF